MRRRSAAVLFAFVLSLLCAAPMTAFAANGQAAGTGGDKGAATPAAKDKAAKDNKGGSGGRNSEPALLSADELTSDESLGLIIARGHVELSQSGHTVQADTITYNQKSKIVIASGNVRMFEQSGEVSFSDYAELTDDMREGFLNNVRMIMSDESRATGTEAERVEGRYTRMNHATYSPCYLCREHPNEAPVWQIRGGKAVHDNVDKDIRYTDATVDVLDVPVFYSPYFSHPDPTVKRRSGFLTPMAGNNSDLGFFFRNAYYYDIQPDLDATLETTIYSKQGPMLGGQVRERFEKGQVMLSGSVIHADKWAASSDPNADKPPQIWRGQLHGTTLFNVNDHWRWGGDLNYASDPTFMRQFMNYKGNLLTSRAFAEGFYGRDYASVKAYRFQDLRTDNPNTAPYVFPLAQYAVLGEPDSLWGGRWSMDTGLVGLTRASGPDSTRVSLQPGWSREFKSDTGFVTTLSGRLRADTWHYNEYQRPDLSPRDPETNGAAYRAFPQGQVKVSYPLVRNGEQSQQVIEPISAVTVAPRLSNRWTYPNEDSRDTELDDTSLFGFNRFVGADRQEGGQRLTYGVRTGWYGFNDGSANIFLGQDYRLSTDRPFDPYTGLSDRRSDYVGHIDASPFEGLYLNYRFNVRSTDFTPRRETLTAAAGKPQLSFSTSYHYDREVTDPLNSSLVHPEEYITYGMYSQLSRYWNTGFSLTQAITHDPGLRNGGVVFSYGDECMLFQSIATMDFTTPQGLGPSQTIYFRVVLKNIGEFISPSFSPTSMSQGSSTR